LAAEVDRSGFRCAAEFDHLSLPVTLDIRFHRAFGAADRLRSTLHKPARLS